MQCPPPSRQADDFNPARVLPYAVALQLAEAPARLVYRVHGQVVRCLADGKKVTAGRVDVEAARRLLRQEAVDLLQATGISVDPERCERARRALRREQETAVWRDVDIGCLGPAVRAHSRHTQGRTFEPGRQSARDLPLA